MLDLHRLRLLQEFAARGSIARSARRAELTDAGRRLAGHAERILAMVEEAETDLSTEAQEPAGRVVATAFPSAAVAFAPAFGPHRERATALGGGDRDRAARGGQGQAGP